LKAPLLVLLVSSIAVSAAASSETDSFVDRHGQLSVKGTQLVDAHGEPIVLRGMSFGWHIWWPQFWNADVVSWMRDDFRCTVLRAAMGLGHEGGYDDSPEVGLRLVREVVDASIANGLYVIIDWHDHHAHERTELARDFFVQMAREYGGYPNVIYEIYNEPVEVDWETVKAYAEEVITAIREVDPDNVILVGSPHWDQDVHLAADDPITGFDNLMYTLHFYAATHKSELRERGTYALEKGLPLFVSEYGGSEASGDGALDMEEWDAWMEWMESNRISWCKWSIADKEETCSILVPGADARGGWPLSDLKESGLHTRKLLRELNGAGDEVPGDPSESR
jgi:endoglucanase